MNTNWLFFRKLLVISGTVMLIAACGLSPGAIPGINPTPTPTLPITIRDELETPSGPSLCQGLSGSLEIQILVGPSEAVGLEPLAVGSVPFTVVSEGDVYIIQGNGSITYQDVLEEDWGTYTVEFDMEAALSGDCQADDQSGVLKMMVATSGQQKVEVRAEGYQGDFPWEGSQEFDLSFPITEGASVSGEGWAFVLHLGK